MNIDSCNRSARKFLPCFTNKINDMNNSVACNPNIFHSTILPFGMQTFGVNLCKTVKTDFDMQTYKIIF